MTKAQLNAVYSHSKNRINTPGVVLLSGGQDSVTVLHYAMERHNEVLAVGFTYGQRHSVELEQARKIADKYEVPYKVFDLSLLENVGASALTGEGSVSEPHSAMPDVPASFVPMRNALFLTIGYGYALKHGAQHLYGGMCETDYSGYPDCRDKFIHELGYALKLGYGRVKIITPLMYLDKAETFELASLLGPTAFNDVIEMSHTCYEGDHSTENPWGYGCGQCPACQLRKSGYERFIAAAEEA